MSRHIIRILREDFNMIRPEPEMFNELLCMVTTCKNGYNALINFCLNNFSK